MMKRMLGVVSLAIVTCAVCAQVYKWTDSQGVIHFSDRPHSGAETIKNIDIQSYSTPAPSAVPSIKPTEEEPVEKKQEEYTGLTISEPKEQETIRNNQGEVVVIVNVEPELFPDNTLQLIVDGVSKGAPQNKLAFTLSGIYRGTHTVAVQVLDANGKVLKTSPEITFFMQRPRVGMVNNPAR